MFTIPAFSFCQNQTRGQSSSMPDGMEEINKLTLVWKLASNVDHVVHAASKTGSTPVPVTPLVQDKGRPNPRLTLAGGTWWNSETGAVLGVEGGLNFR